MGNRLVCSSQLGQIKASDISRPPLGVSDSTDQTSQANVGNLIVTPYYSKLPAFHFKPALHYDKPY
jgi:hypothetical protein